MQDGIRLKAAAALSLSGPELLGNALLELGEKKKDPRNLAFLVSYACAEETRHLRLVAVWAAWQTSPEGVIAAFLGKTTGDDEKSVARAADAVGLLAPVLRDKTSYPRLLEIARGGKTFAAIEAARALDRASDPRLLRDIVDAVCTVGDNHVRKHLAWVVLDLMGDKNARSTLEPLKGKPGDAGKNAAEGVNILLDKQAVQVAWRPLVLREVPDWWRKGRPKDLKVDIAIGDADTKAKVQTWLDFLAKEAPAWGHLVGSALHCIALDSKKDTAIFDLKKMTLHINASEIARCEIPWQGAYVISRDACIAMCGILGEPDGGHRGWEPAYVEMHSFYKTTKKPAGSLAEFVDAAVEKKPWP